MATGGVDIRALSIKSRSALHHCDLFSFSLYLLNYSQDEGIE